MATGDKKMCDKLQELINKVEKKISENTEYLEKIKYKILKLPLEPSDQIKAEKTLRLQLDIQLNAYREILRLAENIRDN